jgi:hypothetical protein
MFLMARREKTFPVRFEITNPTRFSPGELKMYYAHQWEAYQKFLHSDFGPPPDASSQPNIEMPKAQVIEPPLDSLLSQDDDATQRYDPSPSQPDLSPPSVTSSVDSNPAPRVSPIPAPVTASTSDNPIRIVIPSEPTEAGESRGSASSFPPPDFARHAERCSVCTHPDRDAIEADFIRWRSPQVIAREYKLAHRTSVYRHAHATGLFAWRRRELGRVLEGILESAEHIPVAASDVIIRAARIYAHLDEHGNWFEPARINFVLTGPASSFQAPAGIEPLARAPSHRQPARKAKTRSGEKAPRAAVRRPKCAEASDRYSRTKRASRKSLTTKEKANS